MVFRESIIRTPPSAASLHARPLFTSPDPGAADRGVPWSLATRAPSVNALRSPRCLRADEPVCASLILDCCAKAPPGNTQGRPGSVGSLAVKWAILDSNQ